MLLQQNINICTVVKILKSYSTRNSSKFNRCVRIQSSWRWSFKIHTLRWDSSAHAEWRYIPIWILKTGTSLTSISNHRTWCRDNSRQLFFHIKSDYALVLGQPIKPSFDMKMFVLVKVVLTMANFKGVFYFPVSN